MRKPPAKDELSDYDLLRLSRKGNEEAFLLLYRRHQGAVFRFALHMSGSRETAEEVTQEVFLAILTDAKPYVAERAPLQAYLIGVARNQVRRQLRDAGAIAFDAEEANRKLWNDCAEQLVDQLSREQELGTLRAAILSLPPNYREVVVLCDLEGADYAEAAMQLGCAVGTVRSRLHRARSILEAKLRRRERCPA
ncbi:MAG: RNA polymerase sigma factor [Acidobacteriaceae bacterium]|nr:RNA polymerase sigma factor [Acidobacteriaceae bacterium]